jgi:hypothetical protein
MHYFLLKSIIKTITAMNNEKWFTPPPPKEGEPDMVMEGRCGETCGQGELPESVLILSLT